MNNNKHFPVFGEDIEVVVPSSATDGRFCVIIQTCPPGGGPPPHIHANEDEIFIPLSGEFELFDGATWTPVPVGGMGYALRGTHHTFRNVAKTEGRLRIMTNAGKLDEYLEAISPLSMPEGAAELFRISDEHGIYFTTLGHPRPADRK